VCENILKEKDGELIKVPCFYTDSFSEEKGTSFSQITQNEFISRIPKPGHS